MEIKKKLIVGYTDYALTRSLFRKLSDIKFIKHYKRNELAHRRFLLTLGQYLQHTNEFDEIFVYGTNQAPATFPNGTLGGIMGKVNRSEVDIDATLLYRNEITMETVDFSYPYKINDHTFVTFKPEYKPHIFGIFQTFSLNVWITLASALLAITLLSHFILKYKCNFGKTVLHVFAILMKQSAIIVPSSLSENFLVYSWVIGSMILCLSHDSVLLSFLSVPPVTKIKHLSDLAVAVEKGEYNCISSSVSGDEKYLRATEHLGVIADNISKNYLRLTTLFENFIRGNRSMEIAYFTQTNFLGIFDEKYFVSEDRFLQSISSMSVRRGFCCKELLDTFVHRMMASGLYFKYFSDQIFSGSFYVGITENETTNRKLTMTDLAPAFILLLCGHFISLLVFCREIVSGRKNRRILKTVKQRRRNLCSEISV